MKAARRLGFGRLYGFVLMGMLAAALGFSTIVMVGSLARVSQTENRYLAPLPGLPGNAAEWLAFPARFDAFMADNFGLRDLLLATDSAVSTGIFGEPAPRGALRGKDGWLFYTGEQSLELYRRDLVFDDAALRGWRRELERRQAWLAERGIGYLFVVAPGKETIYPEFMPSYLRRRDRPSEYDQLMALAAENGLPVLDLRPALLAAKPEGLLFYKHDTHWNDRGAYLGYRAIVAEMGALPALKPVELTLEQFPERQVGPGDLARMAGLHWTETVPIADPAGFRCRFEASADPERLDRQIDLIRTHCAGAPYKLLMLRDSFSSGMIKYFAQSVGDAAFYWMYPSFAGWQRCVEAEHPDFVIEERVERWIRAAPPAEDDAPAAPGDAACGKG